nr:MAG TPA: hypothetical protein [Caudoviricetes sp.]
MANMPVIGNLVLSQADTVTTIHLGACCAEFANSEIPTPAFGPFAYDSKDSRILGFVGVDSNGQWTVRMG